MHYDHRAARLAAAALLCLAATGCGSGGGDRRPPPPGSTVTVSGRITFDRIAFSTVVGAGLNPAAPVESPARQVVVEALDAGNQAVLGTTTTGADGEYSLTVPAGRDLFIRAKAQMLKTGTAPTWNFAVRNNTNADALYTLDGSVFNSGSASSTRNLHAATGWGTSSYTGVRAAAPFAILDTVHQAKELVLSAAAAMEFPQLSLFWSPQNRPSDAFCPDQGNIGTSSYVAFAAAPNNLDDCSPRQPGVDGIYLLGDFTVGDTDEFDQHVIAHELAHYIEHRFARSDSIGGSHGGTDRLDLRVAFGEGWGNAFSAMALGDPVYRDSDNGLSHDFGFNVETDNQSGAEGWFSEYSVGEILFDAFDSVADSGDAVALGFTPVYAALTGAHASTDAFTSIYTFAGALRGVASGSSAGINALLGGEQISAGADAFGDSETNEGGVPDVLPIYETATFGAPVQFCTRIDAGTQSANKLGNRKFFRLDVPAGDVRATIQVTGVNVAGVGAAAVDPDIYVYRRGLLAASSNGTDAGQEVLAQASLAAGTHIVEIYDFDIDGATTNRCMSAAFTLAAP